MKRYLGAAIGAVLVLTGLSGFAVGAAEPVPPPVIRSAGQVNGGTISMEATSSAPYVRFRLSNSETGGPYVQGSPVAVGADGRFHDEIASRGLNRISYATAVNCESASADSCSSASSDWHRAGHSGTTQLSPTDNPKQVHDPALTDARVVVPDLGDDQPALVVGSQRQPAQIGENAVDLAQLPDGDYRVWLSRCSTINAQVCDQPVWIAGLSEESQLPRVSVRRAMWPSLRAVGDALDGYLNPNGDGFADRVNFRFGPDHAVAVTSGSWRVINSAGKTLIGPRIMAPGQRAGTEPVVVDPVKEGLRLADGSYRIRVNASGTVSGATKKSTLERGIRVRNSRSLLGVRTNLTTFYPVMDDYRDEIRIDPSFNIGYAESTDVVRADGAVVRHGRYANGWWDGRSDRGFLVREGRYRIAVQMRSPSGERKMFYTPLFNLSHKRMVTKTFRKTMTAKASLIGNQSQRCGRLRVEPTGAIRYLSRLCRPFVGEGSRATGLHQVRLPAGDPVSVRIGTTGRSLDRWRDHEGKLINLSRTGGRLRWTEVGPGQGTWFTHALRPPHLFRPDRRLRWLFETHLGREFRVRTFTVVYRYRVLQ